MRVLLGLPSYPHEVALASRACTWTRGTRRNDERREDGEVPTTPRDPDRAPLARVPFLSEVLGRLLLGSNEEKRRRGFLPLFAKCVRGTPPVVDLGARCKKHIEIGETCAAQSGQLRKRRNVFKRHKKKNARP